MIHRPRRHRRLIEPLEPRQFLSTVTVTPATAPESAGQLTFHVSLDVPSTSDVSLTYSTTPITATPNKDFIPTAGKLTIPAGQLESDITVPLKDDSLYETTETLRLNLKATGAKLSKPSVIGTITDDDAAPTFTLSDVTTKEGNAGQHFVTLTATLSAPAGAPITVNYATSDDTPYYLAATAGSDYVATAGTLTFLPGQTTKTLRVAVKGDTLSESDESFRVTLSRLGATAATAAVTIQDDDTPAQKDTPILSISDSSALEGNGTNLAGLTVTLSKPSTKDVTFRYSYPAQPAGNTLHPVGKSHISSQPLTLTSPYPTDYVPASGTLTIPAGQTSATILITLLGNDVYQPNQSFHVRLSNVKNARLINGRPEVSSSFTVVDDEPVLYTDAAGTVVEGITGVLRPDDLYVSNYTNGSLTLPVIYSSVNLVNTATIADPARFDSQNLTLTGTKTYVLNAGGSLVVSGGTVTASTYIPVTASGTLNNIDSGAIGLQASSIDYNSFSKSGSGSLLLGGTTTASGVVLLANTSSGTLTLPPSTKYNLSSGGTLQISGSANTYTGGTWINTGTITLNSGATTISGGTLTFNTGSSPAYTGTINLTNSGTTLVNTSPDTVRSLLLSAFNSGAWTGPGITSSSASSDPDHLTAIGYAPQPDGSVLVKPALYGDANLDGHVDSADLALVQQSLSDPSTPPSWSAGDFNYDNQINADDLTLLDRNMGRSL